MKNNINIILVIIFLALSSCSDKSIDEDPQNTRFSVLKYDAEISETLTLDLSEIELGAPKEIFYWSKDFQNPQNNIAHIFTSANFSEKKKITVQGEIKGNISLKVLGNKGFGYDSIFIPKGYKKTFGEMSQKKKIFLDHRYIAFKKLKKKTTAL